ncbi:MAG TPA: hypothetical protein VNN79_14745 [Actinomycetota bacterium]|nr:hypothetical protein [Actinomycetota bacterium]
MPLVTQQNLIEMSDFSGGWAPGELNGAVSTGVGESQDPTVLPDVTNLLIDTATGALKTRPGYSQFHTFSGGEITEDHYVKQLVMHGGDHGYLIAVLTDESADPDNVQLWAIDLDTDSSSRIDTSGVTWSHPKAMFWFVNIDGTLYGGSKGNPMFSWTSSGGWDGDAGAATYKAWTSDSGASVNTATEFGKDFAWTGREKVSYSGGYYAANRDIRYTTWDVDNTYAVGDRVSRKSDSYWKSYRCIKQHDADGTVSRPDDGSSWRTYWKRVVADTPINDEGETSKDWTFIPSPPETSIGAWFADRLFLRADGTGDNSRVQYSAPVKLEKGEDIAETEWDPTDWVPGNDIRGQGGGWIPFNDGKRRGPVTALKPFGQYLLVFKRNSLWVLSGSDDTSWTTRRISHEHGSIGSRTVIEMEGLVYFLDDQGLCVTDGTSEQFAPGNEKVEKWFRERLDSVVTQMQTGTDGDGHQPQLFKYRGLIGISIPDASETGSNSWAGSHCTVFYDPATQSFWKTDLPVLAFSRHETENLGKRTVFADSHESLTIYEYDPIDDDFTDDGTDIGWWMYTAWLPFGTAREQRRIRRLWAAVRGDCDFTIQQYADWDLNTAVGNAAAATQSGSATAGYIEGYTQPDCHAIQVYLDGDAADAVVLGISIDTEPRRKRYHSG